MTIESTYRIYGGELSYFTRKLEAAMIFYDAPFEMPNKNEHDPQEIESRSGTHQIPVLLLSMPVGFVIGIVATRREHERFDKSRTMIVGASMTFVFIVGPIVLRLMDFFPTNNSPLLTPLLVAFGVASGIGGLAVYQPVH